MEIKKGCRGGGRIHVCLGRETRDVCQSFDKVKDFVGVGVPKGRAIENKSNCSGVSGTINMSWDFQRSKKQHIP